MKFQHIVEFLAFLLLRFVLRCGTPMGSLNTAKSISQCCRFVLKRRRVIVEKNCNILNRHLHLPIDESSFVCGTFTSVGRIAWTLTRPEDLCRSISKFVEWKVPTQLWSDIENHGSIIFVTGHIGAFEMLPFLVRQTCLPLAEVYKPLSNPLIDRYVRDARRLSNASLVPHRNSYKRLAKLLQSGVSIGLVCDQRPSKSTHQVTFLGASVTADTGFARLHLETGSFHLTQIRSTENTRTSINFITQRIKCRAQIHYCTLKKMGKPIWFAAVVEETNPGQKPFRLILERIQANEVMSRQDQIGEMMQIYYNLIESLIMRYPLQYFWLHDRWAETQTSSNLPDFTGTPI